MSTLTLSRKRKKTIQKVPVDKSLTVFCNVVATGLQFDQAKKSLVPGRYMVRDSWLASESPRAQGIPSQEFSVGDRSHSSWSIIEVSNFQEG